MGQAPGLNIKRRRHDPSLGSTMHLLAARRCNVTNINPCRHISPTLMDGTSNFEWKSALLSLPCFCQRNSTTKDLSPRVAQATDTLPSFCMNPGAVGS